MTWLILIFLASFDPKVFHVSSYQLFCRLPSPPISRGRCWSLLPELTPHASTLMTQHCLSQDDVNSFNEEDNNAKDDDMEWMSRSDYIKEIKSYMNLMSKPILSPSTSRRPIQLNVIPQSTTEEDDGGGRYKCGTACIVGNPNVGKSSLLNALLGKQVCITSSKPQTTRKQMNGVKTTESYQIIFTDSPGAMEKPAYSLQESMLKTVYKCTKGVNVIIFVTDLFTEEIHNSRLFNILRKTKTPVITAINKIDLWKLAGMGKMISPEDALLYWQKQLPNSFPLLVSAHQNQNIDKLLSSTLHFIPKGEAVYEAEEDTDEPVDCQIAELIRETIFEEYKQEIPYGTTVLITDCDEKKSGDWIELEATVIVTQESHRGILIGRGGTMLQALQAKSIYKIEQMLNKRVAGLHFVILTDHNWKYDPVKVRQYGYDI